VRRVVIESTRRVRPRLSPYLEVEFHESSLWLIADG
jgi:hypothetical protein